MINFHNHNLSENNKCGLCCTKIQDFTVSIGDIEILSNINLHIHCGEITAIIGPNGAGKTTLLKAILGEIKHTGTLNYLNAEGLGSGIPKIGYVPQSLEFDKESPVSVLDFFNSFISTKPAFSFINKQTKKSILEGLALVNCEHLANRRLGALSGGELQRILLALSMFPVPDILLLDEPSSGMDQNGLELFYSTVSNLRNNYDMSIILVSHDFNYVNEYADRVVLINREIIAVGTPEEVFSNEKTIDTFNLKICRDNMKNYEGNRR
jgi:zinc transport system ATP-binding protein